MLNKVAAYLKLMRFDKPVGVLLLFWPVAWAFVLATQGKPDIKMACVFTVGVMLTRAAGCIVNDMADKNFDRHVQRTRLRPLASGALSLREAGVALGVLTVAAAQLLWFLNTKAITIALLGALLTVCYPFCKRITHLPQLILGITFNLGVLMVYAQLQGSLPAQAWWLYCASVFWTLAYDTQYAEQDRDDDIAIGIKSTAVLLGERVSVFVTGCYLVFFSALYFATQNPLLMLLAGMTIIWPRKSFGFNGVLGGIVLLLFI